MTTVEDTDQVMSTEVDETSSPLPLSDDEAQVLALYDRLQELRLEIAIINARHKLNHGNLIMSKPRKRNLHSHHPSDTLVEATTDGEVKQIQSALLEARSKYKLRGTVVEAVMMANPILKAVHNGVDASPIER